MSSNISAIVYGQPFNQIVQRRTLQSTLATITNYNIGNSPLASVMTMNVVRDSDTESLKCEAQSCDVSSPQTYGMVTGVIKPVELDKEYKKDAQFSYNGTVYKVLQDITFSSEVSAVEESSFLNIKDVDTAIFERKIIFDQVAYNDANEENLNITEVDFHIQALHADVRTRKSKMSCTVEVLQDLLSYSENSSNGITPSEILYNVCVAPLLNDLSREAAAQLFAIAQPCPVFDETVYNATTEYISIQSLYTRINEQCQQLFLDTGVRGNTVLCSPRVLGRLSALDQLVAMEDEDDLIPNHFADDKGTIFTSCDLHGGELDYCVVFINDATRELPVSALYSYVMQQEEENSGVYINHVVNSENFNNTYISGIRYSIMCNTDQIQKDSVINADEAFNLMVGKSKYAKLIPIV